jgi:hypothetical protein
VQQQKTPEIHTFCTLKRPAVPNVFLTAAISHLTFIRSMFSDVYRSNSFYEKHAGVFPGIFNARHFNEEIVR